MNELLETRTLDEFFGSNFKLDEIRRFVFVRNSNLMKFEILKIFEPKLSKLVFKLNLKLEKLIFIELDMCSDSKF